ncbi:hypothetical protein BOSP111201_03800 [Bordetella sputigena]
MMRVCRHDSAGEPAEPWRSGNDKKFETAAATPHSHGESPHLLGFSTFKAKFVPTFHTLKDP